MDVKVWIFQVLIFPTLREKVAIFQLFSVQICGESFLAVTFLNSMEVWGLNQPQVNSHQQGPWCPPAHTSVDAVPQFPRGNCSGTTWYGSYKGNNRGDGFPRATPESVSRSLALVPRSTAESMNIFDGLHYCVVLS